jgi:hypothetical protein
MGAGDGDGDAPPLPGDGNYDGVLPVDVLHVILLYRTCHPTSSAATAWCVLLVAVAHASDPLALRQGSLEAAPMHTSSREGGIILKLDFEKAYDKINWDFLFEVIKQRGFCDRWCNWVKAVVASGTLSVKINNSRGSYFKSRKGVRLGDPLSPLLFNLAADCLTKMVQTAQRNGLIKGIMNDIIPSGIAILQYADDTILCMEDSAETAQNMKILLYIYEKMS